MAIIPDVFRGEDVEQDEGIGKETLLQAFCEAQAEFQPIRKDGKNQFTHSGYATLEAVIASIRPVLTRHGLAFMQPVYCSENGSIYVQTTLIHRSGQTMELGGLAFKPDKETVHAQAATITYARRYALCSILGLSVEGEDDDGNAAMPQQKPAKRMAEVEKDFFAREADNGISDAAEKVAERLLSESHDINMIRTMGENIARSDFNAAEREYLRGVYAKALQHAKERTDG